MYCKAVGTTTVHYTTVLQCENGSDKNTVRAERGTLYCITFTRVESDRLLHVYCGFFTRGQVDNTDDGSYQRGNQIQ